MSDEQSFHSWKRNSKNAVGDKKNRSHFFKEVVWNESTVF